MTFDGHDMARLNERALTQQRIRFGFLFQQAALFDSMTVAQNVAFPLRQHTGKSAAAIDEIVLARLGEVGLPETVRPKKPSELSGGMRKRVGLARALALEPEVVLYDEPTTGLDPIMSDVINELILATRGSHPVTSVLVTHDMKSARKWQIGSSCCIPCPACGKASRRSFSTARPRRWTGAATAA